MSDDLFTRVHVTTEGAVCLGGVLVCDGYENGYSAAAFTHIHNDHVGDNFGTCMHNYPVYVSKITGDLVKAVTNDSYYHRTQLHVVDYESPQSIRTKDRVSYLTLQESSHVLGSSQVLLQTSDGIKLLYSGDISPTDKPPKCDVLVVDSTHGSAYFDKKIDSGSLERRLTEAVLDNIDMKKPVCIHAHRGKLQHLMNVLSCNPSMPSDVKFLSDHVDKRLASVYCKYGKKIRDIIILDSYEGSEIMCNGYPWIEFRSTMRRTIKEKTQSVSRVTVSGSYGNATIRQNGEDLWVASDEHAELAGILEYIKNADPQIVVTDNSNRTKNGLTLAEIISSKLNIPSRPMP